MSSVLRLGWVATWVWARVVERGDSMGVGGWGSLAVEGRHQAFNSSIVTPLSALFVPPRSLHSPLASCSCFVTVPAARCAFFHEVSNASLATLVATLTPLVFVPGQLICTENQPLERVYFINRGQVQLLHSVGEDGDKLVRVVHPNENIGIDDFAHSVSSAHRLVSLTARARTYCDVMSLAVADLDAALQYDATERLRVQKALADQEAALRAAAVAQGSDKKDKPAVSASTARFKRVSAMVMATSSLSKGAKATAAAAAASNATSPAAASPAAAAANAAANAASNMSRNATANAPAGDSACGQASVSFTDVSPPSPSSTKPTAVALTQASAGGLEDVQSFGEGGGDRSGDCDGGGGVVSTAEGRAPA